MNHHHPHSRRGFLKLAGGAALAPWAQLQALAQTTQGTDYKALVCLFMFGGNDGNNLVVPTDAARYAQYQRARPNLALAQGQLLPLSLSNAVGGSYGLHPSMAGIQQLVNGVSPEDLEQMLESELDTMRTEGHLGTGLVKTIGDSLPGLGIVAAVLGIIVTMGHMDAPPAIIGLHVAAALVGTFIGILLCYGVLAPLANNAEHQELHHVRFHEVIKASVVASARGVSPPTAVEFGRKVIFSDERPSFVELDKALQSLKGA